MPFRIKLHSLYTDDTHLPAIQHGHILLCMRFLPVIGPFNQLHTEAGKELRGSFFSGDRRIVNHLLDRHILASELVGQVFPEGNTFHLGFGGNGFAQLGLDVLNDGIGDRYALQGVLQAESFEGFSR